LLVHFVRGELDVGEGRLGEALGEFRAAERLQEVLATPHALTGPARVSIAQTQLRMGDLTGARATVAGLTERDHEFGEARTALAALRLAEGDQRAAIEALAPVLDGTLPVIRAGTVIQALMLDAVAQDQLGDHVTAERDMERALDLAEPESLLFPFLVVPARELLERHPRHQTSHAGLLADLLSVLGGSSLPPRRSEPNMPQRRLSESELRVLRFLPSNLSAGEIAGELYVSTSTVKTHMRHIYEKLDAHRRTEAVDRARELGLLGPSR
jgi:LuxR family transcriptional regulator, maltose regulon positive regulatory protein